MARVRINRSSFNGGEISPKLIGRGDLRAYENGMSRMRNVFIEPTGGVRRRSGLRFVDSLVSQGRLVSFEFNTEQIYLLVFGESDMRVYKDGELQATVATPWTVEQAKQICWTQSADTLLVTHPEVAPKKIVRTSHTDWTIEDWVFFGENDAIYQPYFKYEPDEVTLQASATTGTVTLTASANVFVAGHVGTRFRIGKKQVEISSVSSSTSAQAVVKETLSDTNATKDWEEQSFSSVRGWPVAVSFHQDRLVIGGARDLPNRLWLSKSADLFNFDLGEGLDDEAIEFALLADAVNAIRAVFSGRHLQVFTSGAEWMVGGDPLTPENIQLHRQTRVGTAVDYLVPPRDVDGATLFISRNGRDLREYLFTDVEQAYQSNDLAMLAKHLMNGPVDQDYDALRRLFHVVMSDGTLATLTVYRAEKITAWTVQETVGSFRSIAIVGDDTYVVVERNAVFYLEMFDDALYVDAGKALSAATAQTTWDGFDHLEGRSVKVLADGAVHPDVSVADGAITLNDGVVDIQVGLGFSHILEPMPPSIQSVGNAAQGGKLRLVAVTFRLKDSAALRVDLGRGFINVPFKRLGQSGVLDSPPELFTGDKTVRSLGWRSSGDEKFWLIEQDVPLPFYLVAVSEELSVND